MPGGLWGGGPTASPPHLAQGAVHQQCQLVLPRPLPVLVSSRFCAPTAACLWLRPVLPEAGTHRGFAVGRLRVGPSLRKHVLCWWASRPEECPCLLTGERAARCFSPLPSQTPVLGLLCPESRNTEA